MTNEPSMWSEKACKLLSDKKLKIRVEEKNSVILTTNITLMEEAVRHVNSKGFTKETFDQINHVRLHNKLHLPVELVGERGISITETFDNEKTKSQFKWKFELPEVENSGDKAIKS